MLFHKGRGNELSKVFQKVWRCCLSLIFSFITVVMHQDEDVVVIRTFILWHLSNSSNGCCHFSSFKGSLKPKFCLGFTPAWGNWF